MEALYYAYGHVTSPEMPSRSLYSSLQSREMTPTGTNMPKLMFTVFNGGKAMNSKVKFTRFYLILNLKVQDVEIDAN